MRRLVLSLTALLLLAGCRYTVDVEPVPPTTTRPAVTSAPTTPRSTTTSSAPTTAPTVTVVPTMPTTTPSTTTPPSTTEPTTTPPATTTPPSSDGTTAAAALGWGEPTAGDEFDGTSVDGKRWGLYNGPGHVNNGRRDPGQISVRDGILTITGDSAGTTGGMAWRDGQQYGRWEARLRTPVGDSNYHSVALLWPDVENWPTGGEVDFHEIFGGDRQRVDFFLHYSAQNKQIHDSVAVDATQWHNYAVEWTPKCITGYVDARRFFQDCNTGHLPPGPMHLTLQLDWFPDGTRTAESSMQADWVHVWK